MWRKGRGKLGVFAPIHGNWVARSVSPQGPVVCHRWIGPIHGGAWVQIEARWTIGTGESKSHYRELALIGVAHDSVVRVWSFTSDGHCSQGVIADVTDLHPEAIGFEAVMPAGRARMAYWPAVQGGFHWAVESKTQRGWRRITQHQYHPVPRP